MILTFTETHDQLKDLLTVFTLGFINMNCIVLVLFDMEDIRLHSKSNLHFSQKQLADVKCPLVLIKKTEMWFKLDPDLPKV